MLFAAGCLLASEAEIRQAETKWATAVRTQDVTALEQIFTPALIYAHATGKIEDKKTYLDRLKSGKQRYEGITQEQLKIELYGDSAVAHAIMRMTGTNDAGPFNDHVMMMHIWVKQGGAWRLAAHQTTKIP
jgi:ketosteroid isomerase-like protein